MLQDYSKGLSDYETEVYSLKKHLDEVPRCLAVGAVRVIG